MSWYDDMKKKATGVVQQAVGQASKVAKNITSPIVKGIAETVAPAVAKKTGAKLQDIQAGVIHRYYNPDEETISQANSENLKPIPTWKKVVSNVGEKAMSALEKNMSPEKITETAIGLGKAGTGLYRWGGKKSSGYPNIVGYISDNTVLSPSGKQNLAKADIYFTKTGQEKPYASGNAGFLGAKNNTGWQGQYNKGTDLMTVESPESLMKSYNLANIPPSMSEENKRRIYGGVQGRTTDVTLHEFSHKELNKNPQFAHNFLQDLDNTNSKVLNSVRGKVLEDAGGYDWGEYIQPNDMRSLKKIFQDLPVGLKDSFLNEVYARTGEIYGNIGVTPDMAKHFSQFNIVNK